MSNTDNQHDQLLILHFVHHAIAANPNTAQSRKLTFQHASRSGIGFELIDGSDNAQSIFPSHLLKRFDCTLLNADGVGHA